VSVSVLIADDQALVRAGFRMILETDPGIRVVAEASDGTQAVVLMLTTFDLDEYVFDALVAGASGFLLKDVAPDQLLAAIHTIAQGESLLAPSITRRLIEAYVLDHPPTVGPTPGLDQLTPREKETLVLVAGGLSNAEIADQLVLSPLTIKTHVARILDKLDLRDRIQAVVLAYEIGIVRPGTRQADHLR
jgi:DNA-binding NarL/FixJ family response regulator